MPPEICAIARLQLAIVNRRLTAPLDGVVPLSILLAGILHVNVKPAGNLRIGGYEGLGRSISKRLLVIRSFPIRHSLR